MMLMWASQERDQIVFSLSEGEVLGNIQGPVERGFIPAQPGNVEYDAIIANNYPIADTKPVPVTGSLEGEV